MMKASGGSGEFFKPSVRYVITSHHNWCTMHSVDYSRSTPRQLPRSIMSCGEVGSPAAAATLVIPQYGQHELTVQCVRSLGAHESCRWPVLVVDDGTAGEAGPDRLSRAFGSDRAESPSCGGGGGVRVVRQPHRGVTAAWNRGAAEVRTPFVVFLNNDVIAEGPAVERLIAPLRDGTAAMTGAALRRERALPTNVLRRLPTERFLEGWCFAVSMDDFRRVGGFDETLRVYWSDTDFQARVLTAHGKGTDGLAACEGLPLRHLGHRTAHRLPERGKTWRADRDTFLGKWTPAGRPLEEA